MYECAQSNACVRGFQTLPFVITNQGQRVLKTAAYTLPISHRRVDVEKKKKDNLKY